MTIQDIGLLQAIGTKLDYLSQRQAVISNNVANADTPGYRPRDIVDVDFAQILREQTNTSVRPVSLATTNEQHFGGGASGDSGATPTRQSRDTYEVAPVGNSVILEEQLLNASSNGMEYNLMLSVLQRQVGMFQIAIGSNR